MCLHTWWTVTDYILVHSVTCSIRQPEQFLISLIHLFYQFNWSSLPLMTSYCSFVCDRFHLLSIIWILWRREPLVALQRLRIPNSRCCFWSSPRLLLSLCRTSFWAPRMLGAAEKLVVRLNMLPTASQPLKCWWWWWCDDDNDDDADNNNDDDNDYDSHGDSIRMCKMTVWDQHIKNKLHHGPHKLEREIYSAMFTRQPPKLSEERFHLSDHYKCIIFVLLKRNSLWTIAQTNNYTNSFQ